MPQQLYLFRSTPPTAAVDLEENLLEENLDAEFTSDDLVEQTRELFHHHGSNAELIAQIMTAVHTLNELCAHPKAS